MLVGSYYLSHKLAVAVIPSGLPHLSHDYPLVLSDISSLLGRDTEFSLMSEASLCFEECCGVAINGRNLDKRPEPTCTSIRWRYYFSKVPVDGTQCPHGDSAKFLDYDQTIQTLFDPRRLINTTQSYPEETLRQLFAESGGTYRAVID